MPPPPPTCLLLAAPPPISTPERENSYCSFSFSQFFSFPFLTVTVTLPFSSYFLFPFQAPPETIHSPSFPSNPSLSPASCHVIPSLACSHSPTQSFFFKPFFPPRNSYRVPFPSQARVCQARASPPLNFFHRRFFFPPLGPLSPEKEFFFSFPLRPAILPLPNKAPSLFSLPQDSHLPGPLSKPSRVYRPPPLSPPARRKGGFFFFPAPIFFKGLVPPSIPP